MRRHKVFTRTRLMAEIAPRLYGHDPAELEQHPELQVRLAAIERELDPTPTIQQRLQALQIEAPSHGRELGLER